MLGLALALAIGCTTTNTAEEDRCTLGLDDVTPSSALPGETIIASGDGPFLDERDTVVFVGGVRAEVLEANGGTDTCSQCLQCRLEADCSVCDATCEGNPGEQSEIRILECFGEPVKAGPDSDLFDFEGGFCERCAFELEVVVPEVPPGPADVWAIGQIGTSGPVPFVVEDPAATDP